LREQLIKQMTDYVINVLEEKRPEFSGFAVCPFVKADRISDQLHLDVFETPKDTLIDVVLRFVRSGKRSALIGQPNVNIESWETKGYQEFINLVLKESGNEEIGALCFNPNTEMEVEGYSAYKPVPFFLVNFAYHKDLEKARNSLSKTKYYDKMPATYKKYLNVK
jgi:histidinol phosphatase-like enzyme